LPSRGVDVWYGIEVLGVADNWVGVLNKKKRLLKFLTFPAPHYNHILIYFQINPQTPKLPHFLPLLGSKRVLQINMSATALARQLQKISEASTNTLNRRKLKLLHSTSLIFEPAHAATQDLDTIYSIALEGFNELCLLDQRFYAFERGLFSQSSKDVDRFLLTKDEVKELDSSIEAFLEIVSGRLLLKPAMKATEWLVRRFRYC
jgi:hypothetical protein